MPPPAPSAACRRSPLWLAVLVCTCVGSAATRADSPWLYGIHWYGDPAGSVVESMTGGKGIWSLEIVQTNSDIWWSAAWQRDYRFLTMVARGHSLIVRIERNWGETVPYPEHLAQYLADVQAAAQTLAGVCHIWQIGNEMNLYGEWGGNELAAAAYIDMFTQIRGALKAVPSPLGEQLVLLGPVSPGGVEPGVRHTDGNVYLDRMCALLTPADVDGFAIHAYAAPWNDVATSRAEFQASYLSQLAVIESRGFADKPVHLTEWNRRVEPIDDLHEAQSAQFLSAALTDLDDWNQTDRAHPISSACWFIYQYDSGGWANYSIEYLHGIGPGGTVNDLWDALQATCALNLPSLAPVPLPPLMNVETPTGVNVAPHAINVWTDSGDGQLAIDGVVSPASKWTSAGTTPPHWLQLDLGAVRSLTGFIVRHAGAAGEPAAYNTEAFQVQTALAADGPWRVDAMIYNGTQEHSTTRAYCEPQPVRHVRLFVTDCGTDNYARITEFEVFAPRPPGDYDGDGDVTATDLPLLAFCLRGPERVYAPTHACSAGDANGDRDVDLADLQVIQTLVTAD